MIEENFDCINGKFLKVFRFFRSFHTSPSGICRSAETKETNQYGLGVFIISSFSFILELLNFDFFVNRCSPMKP